MSSLQPVILSGGSGTRLWPRSRGNTPKQFLPLIGCHSLYQDTALRAAKIPQALPVVTVAAEEHRFVVAEQLREVGVGAGAILLEPAARNTAPAIALAALHVAKSAPETLLLVLPADHAITNTDAFVAAVEAGRAAAQNGALVSFGVRPTHAETGYGYILQGAAFAEGVHSIEAFVEKPDISNAERYVTDGRYLWNSGMFVFRADRYLRELETHAPEMAQACRAAMAAARADLDFVRVDAQAFAASPSDSIDYAVMEKTRAAAVVPLACGWSDVGSWASLWELAERDSQGNAARGDVMLQDSHDCMVDATPDRLVALLGVKDLVVVDTLDTTLVMHREQSQQVKGLVDALKREGRHEHLHHRKVFRPWGNYDSLAQGDRFQVKRIVVKPGQTLSLQRHFQRAEHWVVVRGTAEVTCGERVFLLQENQSTFIPLGEVHRLRNPGKTACELIEVQSGSYLGEDDIERLDDVYGREAKPTDPTR